MIFFYRKPLLAHVIHTHSHTVHYFYYKLNNWMRSVKWHCNTILFFILYICLRTCERVSQSVCVCVKWMRHYMFISGPGKASFHLFHVAYSCIFLLRFCVPYAYLRCDAHLIHSRVCVCVCGFVSIIIVLLYIHKTWHGSMYLFMYVSKPMVALYLNMKLYNVCQLH